MDSKTDCFVGLSPECARNDAGKAHWNAKKLLKSCQKSKKLPTKISKVTPKIS